MTASQNRAFGIRVKFLGNYRAEAWMRQFPRNSRTWADCEFLFDPEEPDYDWLVVYNDFPGNHQEELLRCPVQQTVLITMEPPTIKSYGQAYPNQFGWVLTSQPEWALPHMNRIYSQCALQWFYGCGSEKLLNYDQLKENPPLSKSRILSTVCSTKRQRHTLHNQRYEFTQHLKQLIPSMDIYGHGVKEMDDKAEALEEYRYHLTIENYLGKHHWTEKLADVFLAAALPFYSGCPNAADYFPEESFIPIDINDVAGAAEIIQRAMRDNEYQKRLPAILEARRRVLEDYNMFAVLAREIAVRHIKGSEPALDTVIMSRRLLRKKFPVVAASDFWEKIRVRLQILLARKEI